MLNTKNNILLIVLLLLSSCQYFNKQDKKTALAKVYDTYLYLEDINPKVYQGKKDEDSLLALTKYIENWAYHTLLLKQAERNVDTAKINKLTEQYREDLLIDTYKNLWGQKKLDTFVSKDSLQFYYDKNKSYFRATDPLIHINYLEVAKTDPKTSYYKKWFFSNKPKLKDSLFRNSFQFKQFDISEGKWFKIRDFKQKFKIFSKYNERYILKKSKKFVLTDSLVLYLVFVKNVVRKDEALPLAFIRDDLKKLIINKRKTAILSHLQTELKEETIKHKHFKIFKNKTGNE